MHFLLVRDLARNRGSGKGIVGIRPSRRNSHEEADHHTR